MAYRLGRTSSLPKNEAPKLRRFIGGHGYERRSAPSRQIWCADRGSLEERPPQHFDRDSNVDRDKGMILRACTDGAAREGEGDADVEEHACVPPRAVGSERSLADERVLLKSGRSGQDVVDISGLRCRQCG